MKNEFIKGSKGYETDWLGEGISISDNDLPIYNFVTKGLNRIELKRFSPIMNMAQLKEFEKGRIHVVVHFSEEEYSESGRKEFRSEWYWLYCPFRSYTYEKEKVITIYGQEFKGYHLIQESKIKIPNRLEMREIFRADVKFPCCERFSEYFGMEEAREILK